MWEKPLDTTLHFLFLHCHKISKEHNGKKGRIAANFFWLKRSTMAVPAAPDFFLLEFCYFLLFAVLPSENLRDLANFHLAAQKADKQNLGESSCYFV